MMSSAAGTYKRGDAVEVLSWDEIRATLDEKGAADGLPFMPEMTRFCGGRYRVARRADRTCVEGLGERRIEKAVFLENVRCNGSAHDGCQRNCVVFWKEAWLRPVQGGLAAGTKSLRTARTLDLYAFVKDGERYRCQSTELPQITTPSVGRLAMVATLLRDLRYGEITFGRLIRIAGSALFRTAAKHLGLARFGPRVGPGVERSKGKLDLKSGDFVEICSMAEIRATLDAAGKNHGLTFDPEMTRYRGTYEVEGPVERIILETTGRMRRLTHTVTLKGLTCQGLCARNCPRANPIYWREIWLRRSTSPPLPSPTSPGPS
jgi:hypothetical protein